VIGHKNLIQPDAVKQRGPQFEVPFAVSDCRRDNE
jgi:hypothetical protein